MNAEHYPGATAAVNGRLRLLLADDHEMVRIAMRYALAPLAEAIDWFEAADAGQVHAILAREDGFNLGIVDLNMPGANGVDWIRSLRTSHPALPLLVISATEDSALVRALIALGVAGFIPKSDTSAVILQAVRLVLAGGTYAPLRLLSQAAQPGRAAGASIAGLTTRQQEVLALLARGLPNKLIARQLELSESTVKVHLLAIYRVLDVRNRTEAVVAAQRYVNGR